MSTVGRRSAESPERRTRRAGGPAKKPEKAASTVDEITRTPDLRKPSPDALEFCRREFTGREVDGPVRKQFVKVADGSSGRRSVLRQVIAGGGEVRLKMYLTALWWGSREPHDIKDVPASAWAHAFGLDRYSTAGAKRVLDATTWLTDHRLLQSTRKRGAPASLVLLREDASGEPYRRPWAEHPYDKDGKRVIPPEDLYFNIPKEFWMSGWVSVLSGPALMCLCIHLDATSNWPGNGSVKRAAPDDERWARLRWYHYTEDERRDEYTVAEDTWRRGNHELVAWGLVRRRSKWNSGFRTRRQYFEYQVDLEQFDRSPLDVTPKPVRVSMSGGGGASK